MPELPLPELRRCPRCEAALVDGRAALSRTTRDEGAEVYVCHRCGEREGLYGYAPDDQVPMASWPVPLEQLLAEERALIENFRAATLAFIDADELTTGEEE